MVVMEYQECLGGTSEMLSSKGFKVDGVFDGAFGGAGDEEVVVGEGVVRYPLAISTSSSSLDERRMVGLKAMKKNNDEPLPHLTFSINLNIRNDVIRRREVWFGSDQPYDTKCQRRQLTSYPKEAAPSQDEIVKLLRHGMERKLELRQKKEKWTNMIYEMCSIIPKPRRR
ncbi:hypothetical protein Tco_1362426 [Tanacetum coccineum]